MKKSVFEDNENKKTLSFKKNDELNQLLAELKTLLWPIQKAKEKEIYENKWPVSFIVGD